VVGAGQSSPTTHPATVTFSTRLRFAKAPSSDAIAGRPDGIAATKGGFDPMEQREGSEALSASFPTTVA